MESNGNCEELKDSRSLIRVFKKASPNRKLTMYLGKRDFLDYLTHVDPIEGMILVDPDYLKDRKVFVHVMAAFRYDREDLDVLGLAFRKELYLSTYQAYPKLSINDRPLTKLQERLMKKLGTHAYPFFIELPHSAPASVTLQPGPNDSGKPCGVDYEMKAFVAEEVDSVSHKRNSVRLAIRKLIYAPDTKAPQPSAEASREFLMSSGPLRLEASLDKEKYYHGESIAVNVLVDNNSRRSVKKIRISVKQICEISLHANSQCKSTVNEMESDKDFPIHPNHTGWCKVYNICPLLANNRDKRGLALDGMIKSEDTNLASSTIIPEGCSRESLGIIVQYKVKVRLLLYGFGKVFLELPFTLTHPKPVEHHPADNEEWDVIAIPSCLDSSECQKHELVMSDEQESTSSPTTTNHISLEPFTIIDNSPSDLNFVEFSQHSADDVFFDSFARIRLNAGER